MEDGAFRSSSGTLWRVTYNSTLHEMTTTGTWLNTWSVPASLVGLEWVGTSLHATKWSTADGSFGRIDFNGATATFVPILWRPGFAPSGRPASTSCAWTGPRGSWRARSCARPDRDEPARVRPRPAARAGVSPLAVQQRGHSQRRAELHQELLDRQATDAVYDQPIGSAVQDDGLASRIVRGEAEIDAMVPFCEAIWNLYCQDAQHHWGHVNTPIRALQQRPAISRAPRASARPPRRPRCWPGRRYGPAWVLAPSETSRWACLWPGIVSIATRRSPRKGVLGL